ncbi:adenosylcobinamide-GDP ribazoletransferase [Synechococcus sp. W4D4]|uniref:adenosylcobinamide-GDP ribazoletransferase n=1 Tax=Synechococcus sp. W4D4 TaxID=3392294 RepID=UPI0039E82C76
MLRDWAGAWIFYSVLPLPPGVTPRFERIARFAPWVGLAIGLLEAGLWQLLMPAGLLVQIPLVLALGISLSGGLHLDGLMDTADGLAAPAERRLEAMDDSRVGASGVQALLVALLLRIAALAWLGSTAPVALVWASIWARVSPLFAMEGFPYLRQREGTAAFHLSHWQGLLAELVPSLLLVFALSGLLLALGLSQWAVLGWLGVLPALVIPWSLGRRLGGHSGDSYGACVEWSLSWTLLVLAAVASWAG